MTAFERLAAAIDDLRGSGVDVVNAWDAWRTAPEAEPEQKYARCCVAALVFDPADRLLLIRSRKPGRGWELPGGKVNAGELWRDALRREVREEAGLEIVLSTDAPRVLDGQPVQGAAFTSIILIARARAEGEPVAGDDAAEARWFAIEEIPLDELSTFASTAEVRYLVAIKAEAAAARKADPLPQPLLVPLTRYADGLDAVSRQEGCGDSTRATLREAARLVRDAANGGEAAPDADERAQAKRWARAACAVVHGTTDCLDLRTPEILATWERAMLPLVREARAEVAHLRTPAPLTEAIEGTCCDRMRSQVGNGFPFRCDFCPFCGAKQVDRGDIPAEVRATVESGGAP